MKYRTVKAVTAATAIGIATVAAAQPMKPLERITIKQGEPRARFVLKDSGKPFFVKGFNYIRLRAADGKTGGDHATLDAGTKTNKAAGGHNQRRPAASAGDE